MSRGADATMEGFTVKDIVHTLAENVDCPSTLFSLIQVSKTFHHIFIPVLYKHFWLGYPERRLKDSYLRFTEDLCIWQGSSDEEGYLIREVGQHAALKNDEPTFFCVSYYILN